MRKIGIHFDNKIRPLIEGDFEAVPVGRPETHLPGPMEHADTGIEGGKLSDESAGPVRGIIIHHQDLQLLVLGKDLLDQSPDVITLVVRWYNRNNLQWHPPNHNASRNRGNNNPNLLHALIHLRSTARNPLFLMK